MQPKPQNGRIVDMVSAIRRAPRGIDRMDDLT
jgi:hypothetical protein